MIAWIHAAAMLFPSDRNHHIFRLAMLQRFPAAATLNSATLAQPIFNIWRCYVALILIEVQIRCQSEKTTINSWCNKLKCDAWILGRGIISKCSVLGSWLGILHGLWLRLQLHCWWRWRRQSHSISLRASQSSFFVSTSIRTIWLSNIPQLP